MFRFRHNVTVIAVEAHIVHSQFGGGRARRCTHIQRYTLDAAVDPRPVDGVDILRMGVGRVTVQMI